jgi:hypothetical protein
MARIENFIQQLFSRIEIHLKIAFCETKQKGNGKIELRGGSVWMTGGTQIESILKERDRGVEVEVSSINLATNELGHS